MIKERLINSKNIPNHAPIHAAPGSSFARNFEIKIPEEAPVNPRKRILLRKLENFDAMKLSSLSLREKSLNPFEEDD